MNFSCIITCYNGANYIDQAIHSVLTQIGIDDELIIVNDASTDNTQAIIAAIDDNRLKFINRINNGGAALARNDGLAVAKGDYITFLDHDDLWPVDRHHTIKDVIQNNTDADMIIGKMEHFYSPELEPLISTQYKLPPIARACFSSSVTIRRSLLLKSGFFDQTLVQGEWIDLISRVMLHQPKKIEVDAIFLLRRIHTENISHRNDNGMKAYIPALRAHLLRSRPV